jgi:exodeoxyribonuclease VII small subunit
MQQSGEEKGLNWEYLIEKLEKIVSQMEREKLSVEEAVSKFEEGIQLLKTCQTTLKNAEQKVSILLEKEGKMLLEPYLSGEEVNE